MTLIKVGKNEEGEQLYMGIVQKWGEEDECTRCGEMEELKNGLCPTCKDDMNA